MRWAVPFLTDNGAALTIFQELYAQNSPILYAQDAPRLSAQAIKRMKAEGRIPDIEATSGPVFHPLPATPATQPPGTPATQPPGTPATQPPGTPATQPPGTPATQPPGTDSVRDYLGLLANSGGKRKSRRRKRNRKRSTRVRF